MSSLQLSGPPGRGCWWLAACHLAGLEDQVCARPRPPPSLEGSADVFVKRLLPGLLARCFHLALISARFPGASVFPSVR